VETWQRIAIADETIQMTKVLDLFGIIHHQLPSQIPCPVHGTFGPGTETKPSARVYPEDTTVYCYTCGCQYSVTQVAAAQWGIQRGKAAERLLNRWPADEETAAAALRDRTKPKVTLPDQALLAFAEKTLKQYRGRGDLDLYRHWAKRTDGLFEANRGRPIEEQKKLLKHFLRQMKADLECPKTTNT